MVLVWIWVVALVVVGMEEDDIDDGVHFRIFYEMHLDMALLMHAFDYRYKIIILSAYIFD